MNSNTVSQPLASARFADLCKANFVEAFDMAFNLFFTAAEHLENKDTLRHIISAHPIKTLHSNIFINFGINNYYI